MSVIQNVNTYFREVTPSGVSKKTCIRTCTAAIFHCFAKWQANVEIMDVIHIKRLLTIFAAIYL